MKVPESYYDEIFNFTGRWDTPSKCGLKQVHAQGKTYIIVTELYQDNPGTSVTGTGYSLLKQICERKNLSEHEIIYLECCPDTQSKLSFYDEEVFQVSFPELHGKTGKPGYRQLPPEEIKRLLPGN
jgi:hypothetical protein